MDIFNRPHAIAEDTLHFTIYPPPNFSDKPSVISLATHITTYVESLLPGFIWHRDKFEVKLAPNPARDSWILESRVRVGDSVDDEWCTVWLLKEISSKWDVVISVYDSDGEFILIEAADVLPSWVKPANSENRVWIYNSHLHLIPLSHISPPSRKRNRRKLPGAADSDDEINDSDDTFIASEDAIELVRQPTTDTFAPPDVEQIAWKRISGYPDAARTHVHVTKAYLPVDIASSLVVNPLLVQKAVETFYTRDAIQLRTAHRMSRFPPHSSVLTSVRMTRTAYAQLMGQKFFPPKVFGRWKEQEGTKEWRWHEVGMKIAVGFEILYQESKGRSNSQNIFAEGVSSSTDANTEALGRDPDYQKYIKNLVSSGYFKGEVQGSELWKVLENKAASLFVEIRRNDDSTRQSFASQVDAAIASNSHPIDSSEEDSDDWLNVNAQEFEQMLEATLGHAKAKDQKNPNAMDIDDIESAEQRLASEQAKQLKDLASKVENFVEGEGDIEGALFEDEELSDDLLSDDPESSGSESENESQVEERRSDKKQAAMDKLVPALEPSDYGKMPASFHSNSQRVTRTNVESDTAVMEPAEGGEQSPSFEAKASAHVTQKPTRPPIIPRDKYDGVDSDDETDEEEVEDEESEEDRPQVVGEIEVDMEQEEEEFLEFSRQALGISEEQWFEIVKDRQDRGAFLPPSATKARTAQTKPSENVEKSQKKRHTPRVPEPGPRPNVNPELDSFEAVMKALDEALSNSRKPPQTAQKGKGKAKAKEETSMDVDGEERIDIDAAMDAELKEMLEGDDSDTEQPVDYNMIKNFLESFKSQQGLSGPFSNLAGRLKPDFDLPRDES